MGAVSTMCLKVVRILQKWFPFAHPMSTVAARRKINLLRGISIHPPLQIPGHC